MRLMATLVLQSAGAALGSVVGGPLGGVIGRAAGAVAGRQFDQALLGPKGENRQVSGPRLSDLQVQASSEGSAIARVFGRVRLAGQMIWATNFEEQITTRTETSGGKGGGGGGSRKQRTTITEYLYFANFAIGLSEGQVTRLGRVWADGKELDLSEVTYRFYDGSETQLPDSLIETKEGTGNVPGFRGLCYIVFERLALARFGNRIPQLAFELFNALDDVEASIRAVTVIPGATEFGYDTTPVVRYAGNGVTAPENTNTSLGETDWTVSLDQLVATAKNLKSVALVATWFGTDLRCGQCEIRPGVDNAGKVTTPESWVVDGVTRSAAHVVSLVDGRPAFGGTPSDASIVRAIQDLKARGLKVMFYPFLMMDIPDTNTLGDPYTGTSGQPPYPWRGSITCDPAPGQAGTPDKTAAAAAQVDALFGAATVLDFSVSGTTVSYVGASEWSIRRMILHYAHLCAAAGGVDGFLLGSEMRGLTQVRDSASHYPAVDRFKTLAGDVAGILGPATRISYAADWSEYFGHQPTDGSGDVFFHLDPLWSDANIHFVGIDNYMPLSDWRDGRNHLDWNAGVRSAHDLAYLKGNIAGGEGFDWYYASPADRDNQIRTPISDGAYGKPWVFRYKDLVSWWQNPHFDRPAGVESGTATSWVPESKPICFTEIGCPAIDKGPNQPNVFVDPKSSQSARPYYSNGQRDDVAQRRFIEAVTTYWDPAAPGADPALNPVSAVYGAPMVDIEETYIWTWDARPFPAFPFLINVWSDGANWELGHWLNGRLGAAPLARLIDAIIAPTGFSAYDASRLDGLVDGYIIDRPMSVREALEPLALAFFFDGVESAGAIQFRHHASGAETALGETQIVAGDSPAQDIAFIRGQETELPVSARFTYVDGDANYRKAAVESRRLVGGSQRQASADVPIVTTQARAQAIADIWLQNIWAGRERARFSLPMSMLALDPGDLVNVSLDGRSRLLRITGITDAQARAVQARSIEPAHFLSSNAPGRSLEPGAGQILGQAVLECLDLPLITGNEVAHAGHFAAFAEPWPGAVAVYRAPGASGFELSQTLDAPATMGDTLWDLYSGPVSRWDRGNRIQVRLFGGTLSSVATDLLLNGANLAAIENGDGEWEVVQFQNADLVAPDTYELYGFLRGLAGTEKAMRDPVPAGARFVLLNGAIAQATMSPNEVGLPFNYRFGPVSRDIADPSFSEVQCAFNGLGLRPLSPVHIAARRSGNDILISWIRRTRIGGDSWVANEVPLGEDFEAYEVDILDGAATKRTLSATAPGVTYSEQMQMDDWGALPASLTLGISQLSAAFGRGTTREVTLNV